MDAVEPTTQQRHIILKPKRIRSAFTTEQIHYLETQYRKFPYITGEQRKAVATVLKIGERSVKIWFQNRRMKEKKESCKAFDNETFSDEKFGQDQLSNVSALPSTNDQQSNSLPILSCTLDTIAIAITDNTKANKVEHKEQFITKPENDKSNSFEPKTSHPKANYFNETCNQEYSHYFQHTPTSNSTLPFTTDIKNRKSPPHECKSSTSAEFSINLCKKYKNECIAKTTEPGNVAIEGEKMKKSEPKQPAAKKDSNHYNSHPKDFKGRSKKPTYLSSPKQVNLTNPAYYPVMSSVYAPPFVSSGGVLWKPVNFMPVMAPNVTPLTIPNYQGSQVQQQDQNCKCNCHESTQHRPLALSPSVQNQYAQYGQYVITVPFPQTSSQY